MTQQVLVAQTQTVSPATLLQLALPASLLYAVDADEPTKLCRSDPAVIVEQAAMAVAATAIRQFRWWSVGLVLTGLS